MHLAIVVSISHLIEGSNHLPNWFRDLTIWISRICPVFSGAKGFTK